MAALYRQGSSPGSRPEIVRITPNSKLKPATENSPSTPAITWWDFYDGCWLGAPSGLLREDMSPKPAYVELKKLIKDKWWTGPQKLKTDAQGRATFRGFLGGFGKLAGCGC